MVEHGAGHRPVTVLAHLALILLGGLDAWAADKSKSASAPKATPAQTTRSREPSPDRIRDLQATIAKRKKRRARTAQLTATNRTSANAQELSMFWPSLGGMPDPTDSSQARCIDCGAAFTTQPFLSLPPGLDISHGVRLSAPFSMHT